MQRVLTIHDSSHHPIYDIVIRSDFGSLAERLDELGFREKKLAVVADTNTAALYGDELLTALSKVGRRLMSLGYNSGVCYYVIGRIREDKKNTERWEEDL